MRTLYTQTARLRVFENPDTLSTELAVLPLGYEVVDQEGLPPLGWLEVEVDVAGTGVISGYMQDNSLALTPPSAPPPFRSAAPARPAIPAAPTPTATQRNWRIGLAIAGVVFILLAIVIAVAMAARRQGPPTGDPAATISAAITQTQGAMPATVTPGVVIITATPEPATPTQPVGAPTATVPPSTATNTPVVAPATNTPSAPSGPTVGTCTFPAPGDPNGMAKTVIELAPAGQWFHRVFNPRLFNAANNWGGADSWFVTLAIGSNSGGSWTSHGNPGQIVYRGTSTHLQWCLGVLTTQQWKSQFMDNASSMPAAINIRIAPNSPVTVVTAGGKTITQNTSDAGDITVILPDSGVVTISVDYTTAAPTHESLVWWGPYDRSVNINTVDAR